MKRIFIVVLAILVISATSWAKKPKNEAQKYIDNVSTEKIFRGTHLGVLAVKASGDTVAAIDEQIRHA